MLKPKATGKRGHVKGYAARAPFAQVHPENNTWDNAGEKSANERGVMVAEFHAWLVKTRIETEQQLITRESYTREIAPFAQAALTASETPQDLPFVVSEFAQSALDVLELKRKLDLLNVYYRQAANDEADQNLVIEPGNESEVLTLWNWFIEERNSESEVN